MVRVRDRVKVRARVRASPLPKALVGALILVLVMGEKSAFIGVLLGGVVVGVGRARIGKFPWCWY